MIVEHFTFPKPNFKAFLDVFFNSPITDTVITFNLVTDEQITLKIASNNPFFEVLKERLKYSLKLPKWDDT